MDEKAAKDILKCSIRSMALFDGLVAEIQKEMPQDEFVHFRGTIGNIMGQISCDLISATIKGSHLSVDSADKWRAAGGLDETAWVQSTGAPLHSQ